MKTQKIKFTAMVSAVLFLTAAFVWFAPVVARAQRVAPIILKPGEVI